MPTPWQRDLEADGKKFVSWLAGKLPGATDIEATPLVSPSSSGFSNETLLCDVRWKEGGEAREESAVIRIQPTGYQVFMDYDMGLQYRTMELLGPTPVPVPTTLWHESEDESVFGAPFYVMRKVDGRVPTDQPPYHSGGWLAEACTPEERGAIWLNGFGAMAKIHTLDVDATGFGFLRRPELGANGLEQELTYYKKFLVWAAAGREQPIIEAALAWLEANKPAGETDGLVWGDARIGNIIFDGTEPAAVIDWEMVTIGSPEKDLAWAIFLDRHHSEGLGVPRLEGFPSYAESVAHYESESGLPVKDLDYYQVFAGFRFGIVMMRIAQQMAHYEVMKPEQSRAFEIENTVTSLTAKILDIAPPSEHVKRLVSS
jgi:aminoglycoside phosphotransferase (APT) family kinase protein